MKVVYCLSFAMLPPLQLGIHCTIKARFWPNDWAVQLILESGRILVSSLVTIVANKQTWQGGFTWIFIDIHQLPGQSTGADGEFLHVQCDHSGRGSSRTVQCEHINRELWLYIAADLLVQCELELNNNIYIIVQCMPSLTNKPRENTGLRKSNPQCWTEVGASVCSWILTWLAHYLINLC